MNRHLRIDPDAILVPLFAVATAMVIGMLMIAITGNDPFTAYGALVRGALGGPTAIARTLIQATPIILTGLSVALAYRAGLFNIGANGQLIIGLLAGGWMAIHVGGLPQILLVPLELVVAMLFGAAWGAIAGFLKSARGAHEVITTIMLNYIAIRIGEYLLRPGGLLQESGNSNPQSPPFTVNSGFPILWSPDPFTVVHLGLLLALVAALSIWFLVERTSLGYQIRAVGLNPDAARYGGISVTRVTVLSMAIAGGLAGLAGASIAMGDPPPLLAKSDFSVITAGFTGIAVALLGRSTAVGVVFAGLLFGALDAGAIEAQFSGGLPPGVATKLIQVIQGLIIFFVGCDALFRRYTSRLHGGKPAATEPPNPPLIPPTPTVTQEGAPI